MSYRFRQFCLYCSLTATFMLLYQVCAAQYDFAKADTWLEKNTSDMGGRTILMIYKDGKVIYTRTVNDINRKQAFVGKAMARRAGKNGDEAMTDFSPEHKIAIASCSKWLSAALVMTFVDDGSLKLTDTVSKFLPVFKNSDKSAITVKDCLSHMTGIASGNLRESREGFQTAETMDEAMVSIAAMKMESAPGESFHYSSIGLEITAAVIEKISGKDFRTLFRERIAVPCEMTNTDFGTRPIPLPAGSGNSTAADYLRFTSMILNGGRYNEKQVLKKETIAMMQQNYAAGKKVIFSPAEAGDWGYGLGEWTAAETGANKPAKIVTSPGLFGSFPWVNNEKKYSAVLFTFYLKNKGRNEKYRELIGIVDDAISKH